MGVNENLPIPIAMANAVNPAMATDEGDGASTGWFPWNGVRCGIAAV
jgi:hypothetical protein